VRRRCPLSHPGQITASLDASIEARVSSCAITASVEDCTVVTAASVAESDGDAESGNIRPPEDSPGRGPSIVDMVIVGVCVLCGATLLFCAGKRYKMYTQRRDKVADASSHTESRRPSRSTSRATALAPGDFVPITPAWLSQGPYSGGWERGFEVDLKVESKHKEEVGAQNCANILSHALMRASTA
jgi:hypothetical protein